MMAAPRRGASAQRAAFSSGARSYLEIIHRLHHDHYNALVRERIVVELSNVHSLRGLERHVAARCLCREVGLGAKCGVGVVRRGQHCRVCQHSQQRYSHGRAAGHPARPRRLVRLPGPGGDGVPGRLLCVWRQPDDVSARGGVAFVDGNAPVHLATRCPSAGTSLSWAPCLRSCSRGRPRQRLAVWVRVTRPLREAPQPTARDAARLAHRARARRSGLLAGRRRTCPTGRPQGITSAGRLLGPVMMKSFPVQFWWSGRKGERLERGRGAGAGGKARNFMLGAPTHPHTLVDPWWMSPGAR